MEIGLTELLTSIGGAGGVGGVILWLTYRAKNKHQDEIEKLKTEVTSLNEWRKNVSDDSHMLQDATRDIAVIKTQIDGIYKLLERMCNNCPLGNKKVRSIQT